MRNPTRLAAFSLSSLLCNAAFAADPCLLPPQRLQKPLLDAAALDDELAMGMEAASNACLPVSEVCDQLKLACTTKMQRANATHAALDARAYVTDMQTLYLGQRFPIGVLRPMVSDGLSSCATDVDKLRVAMTKRREMATIRRELSTEYGRWSQWLLNIQQRCKGGALPAAAVVVPATAPATSGATGAVVVAGAAAAGTSAAVLEAQRRAQEEAARLAAQKAALTQQQQAEVQRQALAVKEEEARRAKIEADQRAQREKAEIDEKLRRDQADVEAKRRQEAVLAAEAAAAATRSKAEEAAAAEAHAAKLEQDRQQLAEAERVVAEREAKKEGSRKKLEELKAQEQERRAKAKEAREAARKQLEEDHARRREELNRNFELSTEQRRAQLDAEDARFDEEERVRRQKADQEIAAAGDIDVSDERLGGAIVALGLGGYANLSNSRVSASGLLLGAEVSLRIGIWTLAPAAGMSSGFEIRAAGSFLTTVGVAGGSLRTLTGMPELRVYWGRIGLGVALSVQQVESELVDTPQLATKATAVGMGPSVTLAVVDDRNVRVLLTGRWLPVFASLDNLEAEVEVGFAAFSLHIRGGKQRAVGEDMTTFTRNGYFVVGGLGGRLRW